MDDEYTSTRVRALRAHPPRLVVAHPPRLVVAHFWPGCGISAAARSHFHRLADAFPTLAFCETHATRLVATPVFVAYRAGVEVDRVVGTRPDLLHALVRALHEAP